MGVLYKEVVRHRKISFAKGLLVLFLLALISSTLANSSDFSNRYDIEIEFILIADALVGVYTLRLAYHMFYLSRVCFSYKLIDKELIFEKMVGGSRKAILSFDAKYIEQFVPAGELKNIKDVDRTYKFLCKHSKNKVYCCIVNCKGRKVKYYFQPSEELIRKLKTVVG